MLEAPTNNSQELNFEQTKSLLDYIKLKTGMVFGPRLRAWVIKQFEQVYKASASPSFNIFLQEMIANRKTQEALALFESLTVHETMFFRDKIYFRFLTEFMFPDLIERNKASQSLTIWVAAGSSGQEVYSILFALLEKFPQLKDWRLKLQSTDLSNQIVKKGRDGIYEKHEVSRGLDDDQLKKYFDQLDNKRWQVKNEYRTKVSFTKSNLVENFSTQVINADFISCRNVLIYFDNDTKFDIIERIAKKVNNYGYLILGQVDYINAKQPPCDFEYKREGTFPFYLKGTKAT